MSSIKSLPKLIIDTDAGHDDVLAMMLMLKSKRYDVVGITTVAGNSTIENATRNTAFTLDLLNRKDIPIFSGKHKPLKRKLTQAVVHGVSGLDGADTSMTTFKLTNNACNKISELVRANPNEITILTLGPLTNIASVFKAEPELPGLVKEIVIMGGVVNGIGNKNRVAEFNMFVDPEAADIVFRADVKKTLVPFDSCNEIIFQLSDFDRLENTILHEPIKKMMKPFIDGLKADEGINGALLPDPLAAYFLLNPAAYMLEAMDIVVETEGKHTSGMIVIEKKLNKPKNYNIKVAIKINKTVFTSDFFNTLNSI